MKNLILYFTLFIAIGCIRAQDKHTIANGDVLVLGQPSGSTYAHIHFAKKNIIIKRGAIADFNSLVGQKVIVHQITTTKDGALKGTLKRKNGQDFFRFFPKVKSDLEKALNAGELRILGKENIEVQK